MRVIRTFVNGVLAVLFLGCGIQTAAGDGPSIAVYPTVIGAGAETLRQAGFDTEGITRSLERVLNRSRKFTVFKRGESDMQSVLKEQNLADSGMFAANAAEFGKLANVALVVQPFVAEYRFGSVFKEMDGESGMYERTDNGRISLTCKVLDTSTGEIKYQMTTPWDYYNQVDGVEKKTVDPGQDEWIEMATGVGKRSGEDLVNSIFPITVTHFSRGQLTLDRGKGGGIEKGDIFELFSVEDGVEYPIGMVEVKSVKSKKSTAIPIVELDDDPKEGDIVRRPTGR
jgi:hypothetical protein